MHGFGKLTWLDGGYYRVIFLIMTLMAMVLILMRVEINMKVIEIVDHMDKENLYGMTVHGTWVLGKTEILMVLENIST